MKWHRSQNKHILVQPGHLSHFVGLMGPTNASEIHGRMCERFCTIRVVFDIYTLSNIKPLDILSNFEKGRDNEIFIMLFCAIWMILFQEILNSVQCLI